MKFQIILPMAGKGNRVKEIDKEIPKPLLEVEGRPLYRHALSFFKDNDLIARVIPVIRRDDLSYYENALEEDEAKNLVILEHETRGALETVSYAISKLVDDLPVVCLDSDLKFTCDEMLSFKELNEFTGALFTFESNRPCYSYVKSQNGMAVEIAEKIVISNQAICGAYLVSSGKTFKKYTQEVLLDTQAHLQKGELYLSSLFKKMINENKKIKVFSCDDHISMGTSSEIVEAREMGEK